MLSPNKLKAIAAILENPSQEEAAEALGVTPRTLQLYQKDPEFQAALRAETDKLIDSATCDLKRGVSDAIYLFRENIRDTRIPISNRQAAGRAVLEFALRYSEFNDILKELRTLAGES